MLLINIDLLLLVDHMMPNDNAIRVLPCDWCTDAPDLTFSVAGGNKHSSMRVHVYTCVFILKSLCANASRKDANTAVYSD